MEEQELAQLLDAYRNGDREAQRELLERVNPIVFAMLRRSMGRLIRTRDQSADLAQSLLFRFHVAVEQGKADFENEAAMAGYVRQMVKNELANRWDALQAQKRGRGEQPAPLGETGQAQPATPGFDTPSQFYSVRELREQLDEELTDEERTILDGHVEGRSNREIADDLGKSRDAVRMIWKRARERLMGLGYLRSRAEDEKE